MSQKTPKILLVEDDKLVSDLYIEILRGEGYRVDAVSDGEQAYQKMKGNRYDLVLLDVMLPKLDGIDVLRKLKKEGKLKKNKKIFMLTNLSEEAVKTKGERIEIDKYLIKSSLTPDILVEEIKAALKKS
jgi:DNA-binding response OmpR family regulator